MTYFFALPLHVKQQLINYFEDKPRGTKIKRGFMLQGASSDQHAAESYELKNSYIKLEKEIYALGQSKKATLGKGAFGTVKYLQSLSTDDLHVVKIQKYMPRSHGAENADHEVSALYDLGLYRDMGTRLGTYGTQHFGTIKHYIVMKNAGVSLDKHLKNSFRLSKTERFDLAIKLCWEIHNLHRGHASRSGTAYAHRDIKPANIAREKIGKLQLIDVGICETNPDELPKDPSGAPAYLPSIKTFLENRITLKQLDVFALKRVLYMPDKIACFMGYKEDSSGHHFGCEMLFSQSTLRTSGLFKYFDTSATKENQKINLKDTSQDNALVFASLLVLGRCGMVERYAHKIMRSQILAYAVLGIYFANPDMPDKQLGDRIAAAINAYMLCKVVTRYAKSAERTVLLSLLVASGVTHNLNQALDNKLLIDLIKEAPILVKSAAVLLWQNGFGHSNFLRQLKDNEALAKDMIDLIFDGDLLGVKSALVLSQQNKGGAVLIPKTPNFIPLPRLLPSIVEEEQLDANIKDDLGASGVKIKTALSRPSSASFFHLPKIHRKSSQNGVEHSQPWRN